MTPEQIEALIPHRGDMRMVDEVIELEPGEQAVGLKHVRDDEFWCAGHFPGNPVFPGVLMAEALAQLAAIVFLSAHPERAGQAVYLVGMDKMRFRRVVRPGETLRLEIQKTNQRKTMVFFDARATVEGERAVTGSFMATVDE